ncbi:hypothetical protein ABAC460_05480 [Asticcacaulis sp. AC460]|uniref:autotransporter outer membrane beta-barrel domain-containing protein n=1 Tax=Asticcacaulis sp. AC460 TaxID=1282360 RepID=UPI0003C3DBF4|nr:autotransporter-associated beta strand repeat-containing protein [Asticcacaulis sp. AC460]ESQ91791.1 hypothetical protein ABAC460_05480 [Asticcacaulis sp. AC460]
MISSVVYRRRPLRAALVLGSALAVLAGAAAQAADVTITFDDLPTHEPDDVVSDRSVPAGYGGLNWDNFGQINVDYLGGICCGYQTAAASGRHVAYNGNAQDAAFSSGRSFRLKSININSAFDNHLFEYITGYDRHGNVVGTRTLDLPVCCNTYVAFDESWKGLRYVTFRNLQDTWFGLDNVVVAFVPETINLEQDFFTEDDEAAQKNPSVFDGGTLRPSQGWTFTQAFTVNAPGGTIDSVHGDLVFSGDISGPGGLILTGGKVITFSGNNSYAGGTVLMDGTFRLLSSTAAGTGAITTRGSVIDYGDGVTIANAVVIDSNTTQLHTADGVTATQAGSTSELNGPRPLEKTGDGTLVLTGGNSFTGLLTVSDGDLVLGATGSLASAVTVTDQAGFGNLGEVAGLVTNHGTLVTSGTLWGGLDNFGTTTAAGTVNGGVTNRTGGNFVVNANLTSDSGFSNAGGADLTVTGGHYQLTAAIANSGTIEVASAASLTATGLANQGEVNNNGIYNGNAMNTGPAAEIVNATGAVWNGNLVGNGNGGRVLNQGRWNGRLNNAASLTTTGMVTGGIDNAADGTVMAAGGLQGDSRSAGLFVVTGALASNGGRFDNLAGGRLRIEGNNYSGLGQMTNAGDILIGTSAANGQLGAAGLDNSGRVVMLNGRTGDRINLTSAYSGSGVSSLSFDAVMGVNDGASDRLSAATTTGHTTVTFQNISDRKVYFDVPIVLIASQGGDGRFTAATDALTQAALASQGIVDYRFDQITGSRNWGIIASLNTAQAGSVAGQTAALTTTLNSGVLADTHDLMGQPGDDDTWRGQVWMRASTGGRTATVTSTASDPYSPVDEAYLRLAYDGVQLGSDLSLTRDAMRLRVGVTGGWLEARVKARNPASATHYHLPYYGGYAVFANNDVTAAVQVRHHDLSLSPDPFLSPDRLNGQTDTVAATLSLPRHAGIFGVEPYLSYVASDTDLDTLTLNGGVGALRFNTIESRVASAGLRISSVQTRETITWLPFVAVAASREFADEAVTTFAPVGGAGDVSLTASRAGDFAEVSAGVSARYAGGGEFYVRGDARIGANYKGYSLTAGGRLRF